MFGKNARRLSIDGFEPVVQLVEGLHVLAPAEGELSIVAKFQKEALRQLLHRLLQRAEKLAVSKIARRSTLFKSACDKRFRHLIERVHF